MALIVNSVPQEGHKFVPSSQKGQENPFTVYLKPLDSRDLLALEDEVVVKKGEDTVFLASGSYAFKVVQKTLQSWENINDEDGQEHKLSKGITGEASVESVGLIPAEIITEISNAISAISRDPSTFQLFFADGEE